MAKYKVEIKKSAYKEIRDLPKKDIHAVLNAIYKLSLDPRCHGSKKLSQDEKYRFRVGEYGIPYTIEDGILVIYVIKVARRKDVYR